MMYVCLRCGSYSSGSFPGHGNLRLYLDREPCLECGEIFTTERAMKRHFDTWGNCLDPAAVPSLEMKTKGRWGWRTDPIERDTPDYLNWLNELDGSNK